MYKRQFLDNHDQNQRFYYSDPGNPSAYDDQVTMGVACLFALQGIPCLYYGTEQGLHGSGNAPEAVREALWGRPGGLDRDHPFFRAVRQASTVRQDQPALRYGRQYFRPISGNGAQFGMSAFAPGVLAFSRILHEDEVVVIANTDPHAPWQGQVLVDLSLNPPGTTYAPLYSNRRSLGDVQVAPVVHKGPGSVEIHHLEGNVSFGPARALPVSLEPSEIVILGRV